MVSFKISDFLGNFPSLFEKCTFVNDVRLKKSRKKIEYEKCEWNRDGA